MSPPFLFSIDEITESPEAPHEVDNRGNWIPPIDRGANERVQGSVTNIIWYCDGQNLRQLPQFPPGAAFFKCVSVYFGAGCGFWILNGSALAPPPGDTWHPLRFEHKDDYSSYMTTAGENSTLRVQRAEQQWPRMLLPDIYHTPTRTPYTTYGGLTGDLPIFLALIAHSTTRDWLLNVLPTVFIRGAWCIHDYQVPRADKRGVIVNVYTSPGTVYNPNASTAYELTQYEEGHLGKYFN